jgi:hypothetical protein
MAKQAIRLWFEWFPIFDTIPSAINADRLPQPFIPKAIGAMCET